MFDLSSSKLLILGIVALLVVGPKDLPVLLRTVGKYLGMIRRQADEFRAQFNDALRETELDQIKKDVENMGADMEKTMREAEMNIDKEVSQANAELDAALANNPTPQFGAFDATTVDSSPPAAPVTPPVPAAAPAEKVGA